VLHAKSEENSCSPTEARLQSPDIIASFGDVMIVDAILMRTAFCPLPPKLKKLSEEATI
jgi:hypothetical protein